MSISSPPVAVRTTTRSRFTWRRLLRWEVLLGLVVLADFLLNCRLSKYFLDPWTLSDASFNFTERAIMALPMAFLIIAGEIDISVGSTIAMASVLMGMVAQAGFGTPFVIVTGLVVGLIAGCFNGVLVTMFRVPSIVATIGTLSLFRGIAYALIGDGVLKSYKPGFAYFGQGYVWGPVSFELVLFGVLAVLLAIDQGTSGTKAILVDQAGAIRARGVAPVGETHPHPGWVEQDPLAIWHSVQRAVSECLDRQEAARVAAVGLSNQRESIVLWDRLSGEPLSPVISWQDQRTAALCDTLRSPQAERLVRVRSGLPLDPMFSAVKASWLLRHHAPAAAAAGTAGWSSAPSTHGCSAVSVEKP